MIVFNQKIISRITGIPRYQKTLIVASMDIVIASFSAWAAIYLRLGQSHWLYGHQLIAVLLPILLGPPIFYWAGLYRTIFRHAGSIETAEIARACLIFGTVYAMIYTVIGVDTVPRTVGLIQPILMLVFLAGSRLMANHLLGNRTGAGSEDMVNVLIYGAGETGRQLAVALHRDHHLRAVGFLDDDKSSHGTMVERLKVYHPARAENLIRDLDVSEILLAVPSASRYRRRQIVESLGNVGVEIRMLPSFAEVARGHYGVNDIRPVQIEDLLGREAVPPNQALLHRDVTGQVVMVTGGGGSIGSEISRQVLLLKPQQLILVEGSEYALYAIERELRALCSTHGLDVEIVPLLGLAQSDWQMRAIFERYRPQTVYHAAAYKHVPLIEANPLRGIENNCLGTFVTASLACAFGARSFVLISTDKAVRPTNVMGATKRLAELVVQALATDCGTTRFTCVRFGNVLGSSGSVVPLFREQIANGGPITITHRDVTRFFMTIPEAAQLVIQSGAMGEGGDLFLLDMGEPVRIADLAANMIHLSGLTIKSEQDPDGDIEIRTVGLRPGEKLYEELLIDSAAHPTDHPRIMRAREPFISLAEMTGHIERLTTFVRANDSASGMALLRELVPGYQPSAA